MHTCVHTLVHIYVRIRIHRCNTINIRKILSEREGQRKERERERRLSLTVLYLCLLVCCVTLSFAMLPSIITVYKSFPPHIVAAHSSQTVNFLSRYFIIADIWTTTPRADLFIVSNETASLRYLPFLYFILHLFFLASCFFFLFFVCRSFVCLFVHLFVCLFVRIFSFSISFLFYFIPFLLLRTTDL